MAKHNRPAATWIVYRNGQRDVSLQPLRIEESAGADRLDHAELVVDPLYAKRMEDYTPLLEFGDSIDIVCNDPGIPADRRVKHSGVISQVTPLFGEQGETYKIVSRTEHFLFGEPLLGMLVSVPGGFPLEPAEDAGANGQQPAGQFRVIDEELVFNPEIDGVAVGNMHSAKRYGTHRVPVFLSPESTRTEASRQLQGGSPVMWTLSSAVYYLCWVMNGREEWVTNPTLAALTKVFRDSVDFVRNAKIKQGIYLPEALDELIRPLGYVWRLAKQKGQFFQQSLRFFRRGTGGKLVTLNHQRFGELFDPARTNVAANGVTFDSSRLVNRIVARGSKVLVQFTAELAKAWPESLDNYDSDDLKADAHAEQIDEEPDIVNAYRKWVLNEAGDYLGLRPEIKKPFTDSFWEELGADVVALFPPRRRKLLPTLTRTKDGTAPIGKTLGIDVEYMDAAGEWVVPEEWGIELLENEAGIYIRRENIPEELIDRRASAKIRVTATLEADYRVTGKAEQRASSPANPSVITAQFDMDGQFHVRHSASKYNARAVQKNDSDAIGQLAVALRDRWDQLDVSGAVELEGVDQHSYAVGDRVHSIKGKNISFRATRKGDAFPQIAAITYDIEGQKTILHLERHRAPVAIG